MFAESDPFANDSQEKHFDFDHPGIQRRKKYAGPHTGLHENHTTKSKREIEANDKDTRRLSDGVQRIRKPTKMMTEQNGAR